MKCVLGSYFLAEKVAVGVAERAAHIHGVLDPIAQGMRATAVLETDANRIIASGAHEFTLPTTVFGVHRFGIFGYRQLR